MRLRGALFLIALGAILAWAVNVNTSGFNVNTAGIILLVVGVLGLIAEVIYRSTRRRTDVIHESPVGTRRSTYSEPPPPAY
jgi:hypothetical protein